MGDNEIKVSATETGQEVAEAKEQVQAEVKETSKTYTRTEVEAIKRSERDILMKEIELERIESDKVAQMNAEQQAEYRVNKETERADKAERELNSYRVQVKATEYAAKVGLPISFLPNNYENETIDTITKKIDDMYVDFTKNLETKVNESLKEPTPKTVVGDTATRKPVSRASY